MTHRGFQLAFAVRFFGPLRGDGNGHLTLVPFSLSAQTPRPTFQRDPKQAIDESYTQLIRKYTTALALIRLLPITFRSPVPSQLPRKFWGMWPVRPTFYPMRKRLTDIFACLRLPARG